MENYTNFLDLLSQRVRKNPDFTPLIYLSDGEDKEESISYADLDRQARLFAGNLQKYCSKGDRLIISLPQGIEFFIAFFGCMYAGIIAVPTFPPANVRTKDRLSAILEDSKAEYILLDEATSKILARRSPGEFIDKLLHFEELIKQENPLQPTIIKKHDIAYLQYTSGSTGSPKGIMINHENILTNTDACRTASIPNVKIVASWLPVFHDMGLISALTYFNFGHIKCYFMSPMHFTQKPIRWFKAINKYRAELTLAPNFAFDYLLENITDDEIKEFDLTCLKSITCGAEKVQLSTIRNFYQKFKETGLAETAFCPSYGLAEATLIVSKSELTENAVILSKVNPLQLMPWNQNLSEESKPNYFVGNGRAVPNAKIKIVSTTDKTEQPDGIEGEIWVNFPGSISSGYWEKKEETETTFNNQINGSDENSKWMATGDLGIMVQEELFVTGRIKDIIIIRGQNFYPEDIEYTAAQAHPDLTLNGIAVFAVNHNESEKLAVIAEIKRSRIREVKADEVIQTTIQAIIKNHSIKPDFISLIYPFSLLKTTSGKIKRHANREHFLGGKFKTIKSWSFQDSFPKSKIMKVGQSKISKEEIAVILKMKISEKAKIPLTDIDLKEPFDAYPIDSIGIALLSEELSEILSIKVNPEIFKIYPSLNEVTNHIYRLSKHS